MIPDCVGGLVDCFLVIKSLYSTSDHDRYDPRGQISSTSHNIIHDQKLNIQKWNQSDQFLDFVSVHFIAGTLLRLCISFHFFSFP